MHECFKKPVASVRLCKLLTGVSKCLDRRKARAHMNVYSRMEGLTGSGNLSLRMKFTPQVHVYWIIY